MGAGRVAEALVGWIAGPTAIGKSEIALCLAEARGWAILSVDSRQIYRRLDRGTAKPSPEERARVPHLLLDALDPVEPSSAGRFRALALESLRALGDRGGRALAVGGAGFYWEALTRGLHPLPPASAPVRQRHEEILVREGPEGLHRRLAAVDPVTATRLAPADRQRVSRALEVHELTGLPLSALLHAPRGPETRRPVVALLRERGDLHRRIENRCEAMLAAGLLDEIRALLASGLSASAPGLRTVGYREFLPHLLDGEPLATCREAFLRNTRQYAKRQETWLRGRVPERVEIRIREGESTASLLARVDSALAASLDGDSDAAPGPRARMRDGGGRPAGEENRA